MASTSSSKSATRKRSTAASTPAARKTTRKVTRQIPTPAGLTTTDLQDASRLSAVVFGVPADCSEARIRAAAQQLYDILDRQPSQFVMRLSPAAGRDGHHWFTFIGAPGRSYLLEPWLESLYEDLRTPIDVVIHQGRREPPRARRFTSHFANEPLAVDPAYLGALSSKLALIVAERNQTVKQRRMAPSLEGLRNLLDMNVVHEMAADQGW